MVASGTATARREQVPRLALNKGETARSLGVSVDFFDRHLATELQGIRRGSRTLYPVHEIQRWLVASTHKR